MSDGCITVVGRAEPPYLLVFLFSASADFGALTNKRTWIIVDRHCVWNLLWTCSVDRLSRAASIRNRCVLPPRHSPSKRITGATKIHPVKVSATIGNKAPNGRSTGSPKESGTASVKPVAAGPSPNELTNSHPLVCHQDLAPETQAICHSPTWQVHSAQQTSETELNL